MTYCATFTPNQLTLVFSGIVLGNHAASLRSQPRRATPIAERHNFWSKTALLDGNYPALIWDHEFLVYVEVTYPLDYLESYVLLSNYATADPHALILRTTTNSVTVVAFGDCYLDVPEQREPEDLLLYAAGLVSLKFKGTQIPSVT